MKDTIIWEHSTASGSQWIQGIADIGRINRPFQVLRDWLTDWLTGWLAGWLAGWLTDWLTDWLIDWLIDWLHIVIQQLPFNKNGILLLLCCLCDIYSVVYVIFTMLFMWFLLWYLCDCFYDVYVILEPGVNMCFTPAFVCFSWSSLATDRSVWGVTLP